MVRKEKNKQLRISVVIPTKNRPHDICVVIQSILEQKIRPDDLIIIDQSQNEFSKKSVELIINSEIDINLTYIHDPLIPGLVCARKKSVQYMRGDVICFLEDDVILDRDYISCMRDVFSSNKNVMGACGIVTKGAKSHPVYIFLFHLFHRGIFFDRRVGIYNRSENSEHGLIQSNYLSGGTSAYRREVFNHIKYDVVNRFHMLEDIDFSTRAADFFGKECFFINLAAKLEHNFSPIGRDKNARRYQRKLREYLIFYKKWSHVSGSRIALVWLIFGLLMESLIISLVTLQISPIIGSCKGIIEGIKKPLLPY